MPAQYHGQDTAGLYACELQSEVLIGGYIREYVQGLLRGYGEFRHMHARIYLLAQMNFLHTNRDIWVIPKIRVPVWYMGGCQHYGPFLGTLKSRCRIIIGTQKRTIILRAAHVPQNPKTLYNRKYVAHLGISPPLSLKGAFVQFRV